MSDNDPFAVRLMRHIVEGQPGSLDKSHRYVAEMARYDCFSPDDEAAIRGCTRFLIDAFEDALIDRDEVRYFEQMLEAPADRFIIRGNPIDGFDLIGPFRNDDEALSAMEDQSEACWLMLAEPYHD